MSYDFLMFGLEDVDTFPGFQHEAWPLLSKLGYFECKGTKQIVFSLILR